MEIGEPRVARGLSGTLACYDAMLARMHQRVRNFFLAVSQIRNIPKLNVSYPTHTGFPKLVGCE